MPLKWNPDGSGKFVVLIRPFMRTTLLRLVIADDEDEVELLRAAAEEVNLEVEVGELNDKEVVLRWLEQQKRDR